MQNDTQPPDASQPPPAPPEPSEKRVNEALSRMSADEAYARVATLASVRDEDAEAFALEYGADSTRAKYHLGLADALTIVHADRGSGFATLDEYAAVLSEALAEVGAQDSSDGPQRDGSDTVPSRGGTVTEAQVEDDGLHVTVRVQRDEIVAWEVGGQEYASEEVAAAALASLEADAAARGVEPPEARVSPRWEAFFDTVEGLGIPIGVDGYDRAALEAAAPNLVGSVWYVKGGEVVQAIAVEASADPTVTA